MPISFFITWNVVKLKSVCSIKMLELELTLKISSIQKKSISKWLCWHVIKIHCKKSVFHLCWYYQTHSVSLGLFFKVFWKKWMESMNGKCLLIKASNVLTSFFLSSLSSYAFINRYLPFTLSIHFLMPSGIWICVNFICLKMFKVNSNSSTLWVFCSKRKSW